MKVYERYKNALHGFEKYLNHDHPESCIQEFCNKVPVNRHHLLREFIRKIYANAHWEADGALFQLASVALGKLTSLSTTTLDVTKLQPIKIEFQQGVQRVADAATRVMPTPAQPPAKPVVPKPPAQPAQPKPPAQPAHPKTPAQPATPKTPAQPARPVIAPPRPTLPTGPARPDARPAPQSFASELSEFPAPEKIQVEYTTPVVRPQVLSSSENAMVQALQNAINTNSVGKVANFIKTNTTINPYVLFFTNTFPKNDAARLLGLYCFLQLQKTHEETLHNDFRLTYDLAGQQRAEDEYHTKRVLLVQRLRTLCTGQTFAEYQTSLQRLRQTFPWNEFFPSSTFGPRIARESDELRAQRDADNRKIRANQTMEELDLLLRFDVNAAHLHKITASPVIAPMPADANLDELFTVFDQINFTDPSQKPYIDLRTNFADENARLHLDRLSPHEVQQELRHDIGEYLRRIHAREFLSGVPFDARARENFYQTIENAIWQTLQELKKDTTQEGMANRTRFILDLLKSYSHCGVARYYTAVRAYNQYVKKILPTKTQELYNLLGEYRAAILEGLAPKGAENIVYGRLLLQQLGHELRIPNADLLNAYAPNEFQRAFAPTIDKNRAKRAFCAIYNAPAIFTYVKDLPPEAMTAICQANVPASWRPANKEAVRAFVQQLKRQHKTDADIFLELEIRFTLYREGTNTIDQTIDTYNPPNFARARQIIANGNHATPAEIVMSLNAIGFTVPPDMSPERFIAQEERTCYYAQSCLENITGPQKPKKEALLYALVVTSILHPALRFKAIG